MWPLPTCILVYNIIVAVAAVVVAVASMDRLLTYNESGPSLPAMVVVAITITTIITTITITTGDGQNVRK